MLTSPKEESTVVLVIPRNTCELLSLIRLQLALNVYGKTGDLLLDWKSLYCLFYRFFFFPWFVCLVRKDTERASAMV